MMQSQYILCDMARGEERKETKIHTHVTEQDPMGASQNRPPLCPLLAFCL